jgi:hypothetical protein
MKIIQFETDHIRQFRNYGGQEIRVGEVSDKDIDELRAFGESYTAIDDDYNIIGCAGVVPATKFRAVAWGLFQKTKHSDFLYVHRKTKEFLNNTNYLRIEAYVDPGFYPALRWIEMLGFKIERAYIPLFFPNGTGASAWALHK